MTSNDQEFSEKSQSEINNLFTQKIEELEARITALETSSDSDLDATIGPI
ncbi:MAG: hypothetical protein ACFFC6_05190 [Promethearchaeota archaeon]